MRLLVAVAMGLLLAGSAACMGRRSQGSKYRKLTGTCEGACSHYLACKAEREEPAREDGYRVCVAECAEVFSSAESLRAFESLGCDDTVAFVEGSSGRGPGGLSSDTL